MPIVLYEFAPSRYCRAVVMTARLLGIELDKKVVDLATGEQWKPEFLKINPQHMVPTIDDDGFILWESRAIMTYLVNKYAPDSPLYPKDVQKRACVDKMLYFDVGKLNSALTAVTVPLLLDGSSADPECHVAFKKALEHFEESLEKTPYAAGDQMTLADITILSTLTMAEAMNLKLDEYSRICAWIKKMKQEIPFYDEMNEEPLQWLKDYMKTKNIKQ